MIFGQVFRLIIRNQWWLTSWSSVGQIVSRLDVKSLKTERPVLISLSPGVIKNNDSVYLHFSICLIEFLIVVYKELCLETLYITLLAQKFCHFFHFPHKSRPKIDFTLHLTSSLIAGDLYFLGLKVWPLSIISRSYAKAKCLRCLSNEKKAN